MTKIEGPQVMAAIVAIFLVAVAVILISPDQIDKVVPSAVTGIGMLGMKLLEKDGNNSQPKNNLPK